jgi:hypothetical protein
VRLHDLRATFITIKLANGRTETWIADRTGHRAAGEPLLIPVPRAIQQG